MPIVGMKGEMMNLKSSFDCITEGCNGTLRFKGGSMEYHAVYGCKKCNLNLGIMSPPVEEENSTLTVLDL